MKNASYICIPLRKKRQFFRKMQDVFFRFLLKNILKNTFNQLPLHSRLKTGQWNN